MNKPQAYDKKLFIGLAALLVVAVTGCEQPEPEKAPVVRPVLAMKVGDASAISGRVFPGRARATQEANLAFDVSGTLSKRPVNVGDTVKKGQLLAQLDQSNYRSSLMAS